MTCSVCGATGDSARSHCVICGHANKPDTEPRWDRAPEARAFEDLAKALEPDETLLGATRGRITGGLQQRLAVAPQTLGTPYANLGLTGGRVLIQNVSGRKGEAAGKEAASFAIEDVYEIGTQDLEPGDPRMPVRVVVTLRNGNSLRVRAGGRLAETARDMVEVFKAITAGRKPQEAPHIACPHCQKRLDGEYAFCPFCGQSTHAE